MKSKFFDSITADARSIPGLGPALEATWAATSGSVQGARWAASEFAKFGRRLGGVPGEISAALFGAGMGAMGGFLLGPILGPSLAATPSSDARPVPRAGRSLEMEEVFSLYLVGRGKFGDDPRHVAIEMNLYDLGGRWLGFLTGLQRNQTPPPQLFQPPPSPAGAYGDTPVPPVEVSEWTNGCYVYSDGSSLITAGVARSYLVPQKDGSLLFMVTNAHVVLRGAGAYEGVRGIKQGIGAVHIPAGEFPAKFPAPGYEFPVSTIDTFRLVKKGFLGGGREFSRPRPARPGPTPSTALVTPEAGPAAGDESAARAGSVVDSLLGVAGNLGTEPFRLRLPDVPGADPRSYQNANLFRRYGVGEGRFSDDGKHFHFRGELYLLDSAHDGRFEGTYELLVPLSSAGAAPHAAAPPFNLETLAIDQLAPQAFCKERWSFDDGSSLTAVGSALVQAAELLTGQVELWISVSQRFAGGSGRFEGARGVQTSGVALMLPSGQPLSALGRVTIKTIDFFIILREEFIGTVQLPVAPATGTAPAKSTAPPVQLKSPVGVAVDSQGNVYVADHDNHAIRKIAPEGTLSTLAGMPGESGSRDGEGSAARFHGPRGVAVDAKGNVYVADNLNHTIRKITPEGRVSTFAGAAGEAGAADDKGGAARFNSPMGLALDRAGNLYVADFLSFTIRKITPEGQVSTLAGAAGRAGAADGKRSAARFNFAGGVGADAAGNVYVGDTGNHAVRKVTPSGVVSTLAGALGKPGTVDGKGGSARFNRPGGAAVDAAGNVYVAGNGDHTIRKISPGGRVSTLAGAAGEPGLADGRGSAARFKGPIGVAVDAQGNVYVGDTENNAARRIRSDGTVTTLPGAPA